MQSRREDKRPIHHDGTTNTTFSEDPASGKAQ
jgi:hypothetical protein